MLESPPLTSGNMVVVHQGALGDFLLVLAALKGLHDRHPSLMFHFWTRLPYEGLVRSLPFFGGFHTCEGQELTPYYHDELWKTATIPAFFAAADTVLFFGQSSARFVCERLSRRLRCPVHWIRSFPTPTEHSREGVSELVANQLCALGYPVSSPVMRLRPVPEALRFVKGLFQELGWKKGTRPVLLHVGSGGKKKIWPLNRWRRLMRWLRQQKRQPVALILGPDDSHLTHFALEARSMDIPTINGLSLPQLLALLQQGCAYVGNDSGVSHLAAIAGVEVLVIFGPSDPLVWAPRGANVHVISACWQEDDSLVEPNPDNPSPELEAIQEILSPLMGAQDEKDRV